MDTADSRRRETAEYIRSLSLEMQHMADEAGLPVLAYILSLAVEEAREALARSTPADAP